MEAAGTNLTKEEKRERMKKHVKHANNYRYGRLPYHYGEEMFEIRLPYRKKFVKYITDPKWTPYFSGTEEEVRYEAEKIFRKRNGNKIECDEDTAKAFDEGISR